MVETIALISGDPLHEWTGTPFAFLRNKNLKEGGSIMNPIHETYGIEPMQQPHVLLVEDELNLAKGLAMVMRDEGYDVDLSDTGHSAIEKIGRSRFDLLVADLRLPDIDGMDVIRQMREKRPSTKVVVITGYPSVSTALQAVRMGASDYLRKPFTDDEFMTSVKSVFAERENRSMEQLLAQAQKERLIQKEEVIRVLERANQDEEFWRGLLQSDSDVLNGYRLSSQAKAAIFSGDLGWIKRHVGELTAEQLMFIYRRLEREAW
jgi:DNA-binding response OmpR family regulator